MSKEEADQKSRKFAAMLKQVAQEFDMDVVHPDDPSKIYLTFSERNPGTKELQARINQRMVELESAV